LNLLVLVLFDADCAKKPTSSLLDDEALKARRHGVDVALRLAKGLHRWTAAGARRMPSPYFIGLCAAGVPRHLA
jgi:hypothetical protein